MLASFLCYIPWHIVSTSALVDLFCVCKTSCSVMLVSILFVADSLAWTVMLMLALCVSSVILVSVLWVSDYFTFHINGSVV